VHEIPSTKLVGEPDIVVACITSKTGTSAYYGTTILNGIKIAISDAESQVTGLKIRLVEYDDEGVEAKATEAFRAACEEKAIVVIGPDSHLAGIVAKLGEENRIAVVSPAATASSLTSAGNPWFFRAVPSDMQKVETLIRLVSLRHPVGVLLVFHEKAVEKNSAPLYGESLANDLRLVAGRNRRQVTFSSYARDLLDTEIMSLVRSALTKRSYIGISILGRSSDTLRVAKAVRKISADCPIYLVSPGKEMYSKERLGNVFAVTDTIVETVPSVELEEFRARYLSEFQGRAKLEAIDQYATFGFDSARVVCQAIASALSQNTTQEVDIAIFREKVRQALVDTPDDRRGLVTDGGFSDRNELNARPHVQFLKKGKWQQLSFDDAIHSVTFHGHQRFALVRNLLKRMDTHLDSTEKHLLVRALNVVGYIAGGLTAIWLIIKYLF
jgi:ABC-type branched-subunit amino acid transport system substrate-binding protein